ncbi:RNA polymerase sigma factor (sigma-70 family) [Streptomyces umbrinus]|uniref:RNA polymerase sigma factor (Sigma-70 family) n=2 Tax=Streptomyces umbrinus TaxID=67370 RepID=A0ABU0TAB9_9ACTN|nr:RNA polymerase sigma factor (sigma-70 family) [Streptomyces umbrinus]
MLHGIRLRGGRAEWYRNRWIRTRKLEGHPYIRGNATVDLTVTPANTHVIRHADTALRRIGDVWDPAAVGAWLRAIVRNASRTRLRDTRETPGLDGLDHLRLRDQETSHPEQLIEQHAMRDWIWDAVDELPPKLRLVRMLRHFSGVTSYQEIADVCEVPVGTVRSRLNQAREKMAQVLLSTANQTHDDAAALTEDSRHEAVETLEASERGQLPQEISELWPADSELVGPLSRPGERTHPVPVMRQTLDFGVRQSLRHVVAGRDITIWEMDVTHHVTDPPPTTSARRPSPGSCSARTEGFRSCG